MNIFGFSSDFLFILLESNIFISFTFVSVVLDGDFDAMIQ